MTSCRSQGHNIRLICDLLYTVARFVPSVMINGMLFCFGVFYRVVVISLFIKHFCEFHNSHFSS
jgi:hypothetical protein